MPRTGSPSFRGTPLLHNKGQTHLPQVCNHWRSFLWHIRHPIVSESIQENPPVFLLGSLPLVTLLQFLVSDKGVNHTRNLVEPSENYHSLDHKSKSRALRYTKQLLMRMRSNGMIPLYKYYDKKPSNSYNLTLIRLVRSASSCSVTELETLTLMVAYKLSEEIAKSITFLKVSTTVWRNLLGSGTFIRLYSSKINARLTATGGNIASTEAYESCIRSHINLDTNPPVGVGLS
ncbi:hypothetical protein NL676_008914 [Syzygium grande]|nr:hypothetical protein NL676_008914 [Syzygium grande]